MTASSESIQPYSPEATRMAQEMAINKHKIEGISEIARGIIALLTSVVFISLATPVTAASLVPLTLLSAAVLIFLTMSTAYFTRGAMHMMTASSLSKTLITVE